MSFVTLERQRHVGILTLRRPEALNAINSQVLADLDAAIDQAEADEDLHAVIVTGEGRTFATGADIGEMKEYSAAQGCVFGAYGGQVFQKLAELPKPVIAAVNGFALGGGCELAMACDIRLASETARFGQPEVGLGITPGFGGTQRLPRIVGLSNAMDLIFSGRTIGAVEAQVIGLVSRVYPPEALFLEAMKLAGAICANAPVAVREAKRCIHVGMQTDLQTGLAFEAQAFGICCGTEDKDEGMSAFLEKRKEKNFTGK
ncbi:enoyl-CoA hydratase-related protein [Candidatus Pseudoscillospira sp. SGI.172]|uniref:enoyl-CoA hydratase-related protein n=1 Tax=Candidatus Pseudoscillospira sp. SGI.172 TaxID=3420582 RepID=UPI0009BC432B